MLDLALSIESAALRVPAIPLVDPLTLSPTAWYDPSDSATMFQTGTRAAPGTAAGIGDPVGLMLDKSGNNNDLVQATAGARPVRQSGYLVFNGSSWLRSVFAIGQTMDRLSAIKNTTRVLNGYIYDGALADKLVLIQTGATPQLSMYSGAFLDFVGPAVGTSGVITERFTAVNSQGAYNNNAYVTLNIGSASSDGLTIGASGNDTYGAPNRSQFEFYGMVLKSSALTDPQIAQLRTYLGSKVSLVL